MADDLQKAVARTLDAVDTNTDGICDICNVPIDQHPCAEHQQAVMVAQVQTQAEETAAAWGLPLSVPGRF